MADPLASGLAIVTAAIQSTNSLRDTIKRFQDRNATLRRLLGGLDDLVRILEVLEGVADSEASMMGLLKGPINRCRQVCREFENTVNTFRGKSKVGFLDWAKLEFMRGNINDFIDTVEGYKSTISVGLGAITMQKSKLSQQVLEEYNEMIKDTVYNLTIHLHRIDEKIGLFNAKTVATGSASALDTNIDLEDERAVTEQCLRICEDAKTYIESLADQGSFLNLQTPLEASTDTQKRFAAQRLIRQVLDENRDNLTETIGRLRERLESLPVDGTPQNDRERLRLQQEIQSSNQCLEVCKLASNEVAHQKVYRVGELIADGDSDQVVITTLADLFDVKKASSTDRAAQWIGSMTDETAQQISKDRYSSRFGAVVSAEASNNPRPLASDIRKGKIGQSSISDTIYTVASANETRKRTTGVEGKDVEK